MPTGSAFCLYAETSTGRAVWGTSWPKKEWVRHEWAGAWICSIFRNEGAGLSSQLIRQAISATLWHYGDPPDLGIVTFVKQDAVKEKKDFGHCFVIAGFRPCGFTKVNKLVALQMKPEKMPKPQAPRNAQLKFF